MIKQFIKSSFAKNVSVLASGTIIGQAAPILFSPILSRLFSPAEFGTLAIFLAISSFISNVSMFRYEFAVVLPKKDRDALHIVSLSISILLFVTLLTGCFICLFRFNICKIFNEPQLVNWLLLVPFYIFIQGIWRLLNYWSTRKGNFKDIAIGNVLRTYGNSIVSVGLGVLALGKNVGLILGTVIGQLFETTFLLFQRGKILRVAIKNIKRVYLKEYAIRYKRFLLIDTPHVIIDNINNQGSPFIIAYYFSKQSLGYYSFMMRILRLPVALIGSSISQVLYRTIAHSYANEENISSKVKKITFVLFLFSVIPSLILFFFAPKLFAFVFGEEWRIAGEYASILSLYMCTHFVVSSLSFVPYVIGRMKFDFIFSTICNLLFVLLLIASSAFGNDFSVGLWLINIVISSLYMGYIIWILRIVKQ
ncbi:oligosaccharide flippase family protein [Bacteroides uniformis]|uniref:Oligosaccharide flippase family protein n=1 Tax=Bacteroides uniformis TaxID=820 RepID=A0AAW6GRF0_BACUN|nr:oligosaccharide flippase family protein [Bacteroides uniformis]MDC1881144.1 oligosaccharide flippase family protein [Bacteroides uniformis]MDC1885165.1 oligosaccharide flippase family protein [Bacteroides uniformis]MDT4443131.1 oligosaccharide flippase family protein [Bacteroides uniformis]